MMERLGGLCTSRILPTVLEMLEMLEMLVLAELSRILTIHQPVLERKNCRRCGGRC